MKTQKYVVDAKPLIDLLLSIYCEVCKKRDICKKYDVYFLKLGEKEKEIVLKRIYNLATTKRIVVTPHILAETYDVLETKYKIKGKLQEDFWANVKDFLEKIREEYVKKEDILNEEMFVKYGFADTSVYLTAKKLRDENKEYEIVLVTGESKDEGRLKSLSGRYGFYVKGFEEIFWEWIDASTYFS